MKENQLLRFTTAGSVDDGKSTLIGRLLYDSKALFGNQLEAVKSSSQKKGFDYIDLSLITDALRSGREQEHYHRRGLSLLRHVQYTRNVAARASTAKLAVILIDARKGMVEQTFRHTFIATLLRIPHIVVCVNKMDLVNWSETTYENIVEQYKAFVSKLEIADVNFVPISALHGDNVVDRSANTAWYEGQPCCTCWSTFTLSAIKTTLTVAFRYRWLFVRRHEHRDYRGYAGRLEGGVFKRGDAVAVLPSAQK